jgi:hypothetical protein
MTTSFTGGGGGAISAGSNYFPIILMCLVASFNVSTSELNLFTLATAAAPPSAAFSGNYNVPFKRFSVKVLVASIGLFPNGIVALSFLNFSFGRLAAVISSASSSSNRFFSFS